MPGIALSILLTLASAPATNSCVARAGAVTGEGSTLPIGLPGINYQKSHAIEKLRKKAKDGRTIVIDGGDFTAYDFRKAKLDNICFRGSKLVNTDWSGSTSTGMGFIDSDLTGSVVNGAIMRSALFRTTTLASVDATAADLSGGRLDGGWNASLKNLKLDLARLGGFRFVCGTRAIDGCPFDRQGITARNADFSGVIFDGFSLWGATVEGAVFDGAEMAIEDVGQIIGATEPNVLTLHHRGMSTLVDGPVAMVLAGALITPGSVAGKCATPANALETAFCDDKTGQLMSFDADVVRLVASGAVDKRKAVLAFDKGRDACLAQTGDTRVSCLIRVYRTRRAGLLATNAPMTWMKRARKVLFVRNDIALASGATTQPSWPGVAQVLVRLSPAYMLARVEGSKRVTVRGFATTPGSGSCSLHAETTAVGSGGFNAAVAVPGKRKMASIALFRVIGEQAIVAPVQDDVATPGRLPVCNGVASFGTMKRLPIDDMVFESLWGSTLPLSVPVSAPAPAATPSSPPVSSPR